MNKSLFMMYLVLLLALLLTIIPLNNKLVVFRPPWILLSILYIQFYIPHLFKLSMLVWLGFIMDSLLYTIIGEHVFALTIIIWLTASKVRSFGLMTMEQQMLLIGVYC